MMNAQEYLESILVAGRTIEKLNRQIDKLHDSLTSISAPMDKEQVTHTRNVSVMADQVARIVDLEQEIKQKREQLRQMRLEALYYINQLDADTSMLLTMRYIDGKGISEIMKEQHFSKASAFRALSTAVEVFQQFWNLKNETG